MDREAELIVKAVKQGAETVLKKNDVGHYEDFYTLSDLKVEKVYEDRSGEGIKEGASIKVSENAAYDEEENLMMTIANYQLMKDKEEYLLFLKKGAPGEFTVSGVYQGKIPLSSNALQFKAEDDDELEEYKQFVQEAKQKYK